MERIRKLNGKARLGELSGTVSNIEEAYVNSGIDEDTTLDLVMSELLTANGRLTTAIEQNKALSDLEDHDEPRDYAYKALYHYLKGCSLVPEGELKKAAVVLFATFKKYGVEVTELSYNEQTGQVNSLLEELASEENKKHIAAIANVEEMVAELKNTQAAFQKAYDNYLTRISESKSRENASDVRPLVLNALNNKLVTYLRSQILFSPEVYTAFATKVSTAIDKTNQNIRERATKKKTE